MSENPGTENEALTADEAADGAETPETGRPSEAEAPSAESATDRAEATPTASDTADDEAPEEGELSRSAQRRRRAERARLYRAEHEAQELRRKTAELEARLAARENPKPRLADYDTDDEYEAAYEAWIGNQRAGETPASTPSPAAPLLEIGMTPSQADDLLDSINAARSRHADFQQVVAEVNSQRLVTDDLMLSLADEDDPGEILYALAKDAKTLREIVTAPTPRARDRQLGAYLERRRIRSATPARIPSTAPAPVTTLEGRGGGEGGIDYEKMSAEEFKAQRRRERAR